MTTYGTATYNGTTYTLYGFPGSTLRDELNRLANGGEYPPLTEYKDVDGASVEWAAINWHGTVHCATTTSITSGTYASGTTGADGGNGVGATYTANVNGTVSIDGHLLQLGDQVLIWKQTDAKVNGLYTVTNAGSPSTRWVFTRSNIADNGARATEVIKGDWVYVTNGNTNAGKTFRISADGSGMFGAIVIGTDNITFTETTIPAIQIGTTLVRALNYKVDPLRPPTEYKALNAAANEIAGTTSDPSKYLEIVTALRTVAS